MTVQFVKLFMKRSRGLDYLLIINLHSWSLTVVRLIHARIFMFLLQLKTL